MTATDERTGLPATSRAVVVGLSPLLAALLLRVAGPAVLLVAVFGVGLSVAGSLWLVGWTKWRAVGRFLASLLLFPTGVGLLALVVVSTGDPPPSRPPIAGTLAALSVTGGCLLAVLGAAATTRGVVDRARTRGYVVVAGSTAVPLAGGAALSFLDRALRPSPGEAGPERPLAELVAPVADPLFAPTPGRTHLVVFCLFLAVVALAVERTVTALPLAELAPATGEGPDLAGAVGSTRRALGWLALLSFCGTFVATVAEAGAGQAAIADALPAAAYDLLVAVTAWPALRTALWTLLLASAAVWLAAWLVRRAARSSAARVGTIVAPSAGGTVLAVGLFAVAGPAFERVQAAARADATAPLTGVVTRQVTPLVESYGAETVLLGAALAVLSVAGSAGGSLWLALVVRYVDESLGGVHLAAAGLFGASAFAATLGASRWLVLAGLVGAVVVWDAGEFGTTLRGEVGSRADTRRAELTHVGGTVAVGGVGAALALAVPAVARGVTLSAPDTGYLALLVALFAAVALVAALR